MIQRTYSELNMDMLVFENRNQSYGAFEIRRVYNSHIRNSLLIAIFFSAGIFGGLYLINKNVSASAIASIKPFDDVLISPEDIKTMTYHPEVAKPVLQTPVAIPTTQVVNTRYKPVNEVVETTTISEPSELTVSTQGTTGIGEAAGIEATSGTEVTSITPVVDEVIDFSEVKPEFNGGIAAFQKFISQNLVYPNRMINQGISGKVHVSFVVEKDGSISMIQIVKGVAEELDAEALRVISKMPSWKPGLQNGKAVRVKHIVPIVFNLN